jgi:hypothetical protein
MRSDVVAFEADMVGWRRQLHARPELSLEEVQTQLYLEQVLWEAQVGPVDHSLVTLRRLRPLVYRPVASLGLDCSRVSVPPLAQRLHCVQTWTHCRCRRGLVSLSRALKVRSCHPFAPVNWNPQLVVTMRVHTTGTWRACCASLVCYLHGM